MNFQSKIIKYGKCNGVFIIIIINRLTFHLYNSYMINSCKSMNLYIFQYNTQYYSPVRIIVPQ